MEKRHDNYHLFLLLLGVIAVSTGAIFTKLADEVPAITLSAYRLAIPTLIFFPFAWVTSKKEIISLNSGTCIMGILSGIALAGHFTLWITSLGYTSIARSLVFVNTTPLWIVIFAPFITGEKITRPLLISIAVSMAGVIFMGLKGDHHGSDVFKGDALALAGGACLAIYLMLGNRIRRELSLLPYVCLCYGAGSAILWLIVLFAGLPCSGFSFSNTLAILGIAIIPQVFGHTIYNWSLKWLSTGIVSVTLFIEPVMGALYGYFLFHERLSLYDIIGGTLILTGVFFVSKYSGRAKPL